jgi:hypothetical protein
MKSEALRGIGAMVAYSGIRLLELTPQIMAESTQLPG